MYLFNRSISVNIRSLDEKTIKVDGFFLDSHHELCLTLDVDIDNNSITSADGEFRRAPHTDCAQTQEKIQRLIGVNLNRNVRKQVQAAVGQEHGCTHLTDLTLECIKGIIQAKFQLMHHNMQAKDVSLKVQQYLAGSCQHYKKF